MTASTNTTTTNKSATNSDAGKRLKQHPTPPFKEQSIGDPPGVEEKMDPKPQFQMPSYKGSEKLKDKTALITGGDSGIGRAVAVLFAREGANVAFTYTKGEEEDAKKTVSLIEQEGQKALKCFLDVTDYKDCIAVATEVEDRFGKIDILVNNAAFQNHVKNFETLDITQIKKTFEVNVFGYIYMIKAVYPFLHEGSSIINTSSILGVEGSGTLIDYSATKAAIHNLTKSLAQDFAKKSIRVNAVAPGPVWTPLNPAERSSDEVKEFGSDTLCGRPAQPEEVAPAYVYLASNITSGYVTGETINVFGSTSGAN